MKFIMQTTALMITSILLIACGGDVKEKETNTEAAVASPAIAEVPAEEEQPTTDGESIAVRGYVDVPPENRVSISPFYGGFVKDIHVLPGTRMKWGDVLFTLQNPLYLELQEQYLEASEQLEYLKEDYTRQQVLAEEEISSQKNYKKAESDYKVMVAKAGGLRERLKMLGISIAAVEGGTLTNMVKIYSGINGSVTKVNIQKGAYLEPKDVAVELVNTEHLHLELEVFERDALKIREGQNVTFRVPETSDREFVGEVHLVVPAIDMQTRTFLVHAHFDEAQAEGFLPGMFVEAQIQVEKLKQ